jgi:hypothetical protein
VQQVLSTCFKAGCANRGPAQKMGISPGFTARPPAFLQTSCLPAGQMVHTDPGACDCVSPPAFHDEGAELLRLTAPGLQTLCCWIEMTT